MRLTLKHRFRTPANCALVICMLLSGFAVHAEKSDLQKIQTVNERWLSTEPTTPADANNFVRALVEARRHDAAYAGARAALDAGREAWPQARASILPSVQAEITIAEIERDVEETPFSNAPGGAGGGAGGPPSAPFSDGFTNEEYRIELRQTLFDYGVPARLRQGETRVTKAELEFAIARKTLISRLANAYLNFLVAGEQLDLAVSEKTAVAEDLELAQARYEVGETGVTGYREAQSAYDLANARLVDARTGLEDAREALFEVTRVSYPQLPGLREKVELQLPEPAGADAWVKIALDFNGEYLKAQQDVKIAADEIKNKRGGQLPQLDLVAAYSELDNTEFVFGSASQDASIGLEATWNLFSGGRVFSEVREAEARYVESKAQQLNLQRQVTTRIRGTYRAIVQAIERIKAQEQVIVSARSALEATNAGFEFGERTQADVLTARNTLFQARVDYTNARYNYLIELLDLRFVAGILSQEDIQRVGMLLGGDPVPSAVNRIQAQE